MSKIDQKQYLRWLKDCNRSDFALVGGKNANLGEMIKADFPVPLGFAVTVESYKETLTGGGLVKEIQDALFSLDVKDTDSIDKAGQYIRGLIEAEPIPPVVEEQVWKYYEALCREHGIRNLPVAVRSSATAEDSPSASFAGQQDTYLWVKGDELIRAIVKCQASLFTSRAIAYRTRMGFLHDKVFISVGVQKMVHAKAAGVMFTLNPANGDRSKIMVGGSWGLGESVVSGEVTPDEWAVDKVVFEIIKTTIAPKGIERIVDKRLERVITANIPSDRQSIPCLDNGEVIELAKLGKRIEEHFGLAQDIEWVIDKDLPFPQNIFIVQTRPETVWSLKKGESKLKTTGKATADVVQFWLNIKA
jgi:pyruvate,water dikinase